MALLINRNTTVLGDIDLSQLYVRLSVAYGPGGTPLEVRTNVYSSKASYDDNPSNSIHVVPVSFVTSFPYDRETDGDDVLGFAHNKIKEVLTTDEYGDVPVLDPSTGEPTYDPSTGELITENVITSPKFCADSSISFVDVTIV